MTRKRKRNTHGQGNREDGKRQRVSGSFNNGNGKDPVVKNALLAQYYPRVVSLREYLLSKLPPTSKIRRKKILTVGRNPCAETRERDQALADALDRTLVGIPRHGDEGQEERSQLWASFSQWADVSKSTLGCVGEVVFSQSEVSVDS